MRCAVYARYSSDLQNDRSIDDQIRNCRNFAERASWTILEDQVYADRAVSGATTIGREGLQLLLSIAKSKLRPFDYVLIDDTSRLSRDQIDQQEIVRELAFVGVYIYFVSQQIDSKNEQAVDVLLPVHGITDSMFRRDLAQKTHRGMAGQVLKGFNPGGRTYGYSYSKLLDEDGTIDKKTGQIRVVGTQISIDNATGNVVKEIFSKFAAGSDLRDIARNLNDRSIPPPGSEAQRRLYKVEPSWCPNAIRYILQNRKYIGDWTWNKHKFLTDRKTGKRRYQSRPREEWVEVCLPSLQIVPQETWVKVAERFEANKRKGVLVRGGIRNTHLLSGLLKCNFCGGRYVIIGGGSKADPLYGCSLNWNRGKTVCTNSAKVRKSELELKVLSDLKTKLFSPLALSQIVEETNEKLKSQQQQSLPSLSELCGKRGRVRQAVDNLLSAIESGATFSMQLRNRLSEKEAELNGLDSEIQRLSEFKQRRRLTIDKAYSEKWIFRLEQILSSDMNAARSELRTYLKEIELEPVQHDGLKYLQATSKPNFAALLSVAGGFSKECNSGGRI